MGRVARRGGIHLLGRCNTQRRCFLGQRRIDSRGARPPGMEAWSGSSERVDSVMVSPRGCASRLLQGIPACASAVGLPRAVGFGRFRGGRDRENVPPGGPKLRWADCQYGGETPRGACGGVREASAPVRGADKTKAIILCARRDAQEFSRMKFWRREQ